MEDKKLKFCCDMMDEQLNDVCDKHEYFCPDYAVRRRNDGTIVIPIDPQAGGGGYAIKFCPWCGQNLFNFYKPKLDADYFELLTKMDKIAEANLRIDYINISSSFKECLIDNFYLLSYACNSQSDEMLLKGIVLKEVDDLDQSWQIVLKN